MDPVEHTFNVALSFTRQPIESAEIMRKIEAECWGRGSVVIHGDAVVVASQPMTEEAVQAIQTLCDSLTALQEAERLEQMRVSTLDPERPVLVPTPAQEAATEALFKRAEEAAC